MTIGEKIKELRKEQGWSQATLGKMIGVSQKAINYWESGTNEPKIGYIMSLIDLFELSYDEFFAEVENPNQK